MSASASTADVMPAQSDGGNESFGTIAVLASRAPEAQRAAKELTGLYDTVAADRADVIVALGGDGFMLHVQARFMNTGTPVYGMNKGTVGFLMNAYNPEGLHERLAASVQERIHPLQMRVTDSYGQEHRAMAINEVSLFRASAQAARLSIEVDGHMRLENLVCDGVMVATPQGSTAYNLSAQGPILPLKSPLLALTPVSPFRPRGWRGALLPNTSRVRIHVRDIEKRPVFAVADHTEVREARTIDVHEDRERTGLVLFDAADTWDERVLSEQFSP